MSVALDSVQLFPAVGSFNAYVDMVYRLPMLSAEEERRFSNEYRKTNNLVSARQLVLSHLRCVVKIVRGYRGYGLSEEDLVQEGNIGLMKAVRRFDPSLGVRLVSFAVHWIRAEIHEFVLRNWSLVKVATSKAQRKLFFKLRSAKQHIGWLSQNETHAIASNLNVAPRDVIEMEKRLSGKDVSLDGAQSSESQTQIPLLDYIGASPSCLEAEVPLEEAAEQQEEKTLSRERLGKGLAVLDKRALDIVKRRWLQEKKETLQELATRHRISAERVRQLEQNALIQIKQAMWQAPEFAQQNKR